ncbi:unnamed protein product [Acanthoscelides obtectus]|uniref:Uncharacterized protein n=1 Tax=Acanthoscelides obtectus TaxID=200917 RepID=A0A9P0VQH3_ACAOB|nr:unnamed protein product [Acanthoscelides obtectus]CAK1658741.1 V-type proton ATPase subunit G [Acanthoscelides obtectus]
MASQSQGIQQLLAAEKRAAEKVAEARKHFSFKSKYTYQISYFLRPPVTELSSSSFTFTRMLVYLH